VRGTLLVIGYSAPMLVLVTPLEVPWRVVLATFLLSGLLIVAVQRSTGLHFRLQTGECALFSLP